jgi:hypothetical protein
VRGMADVSPSPSSRVAACCYHRVSPTPPPSYTK